MAVLVYSFIKLNLNSEPPDCFLISLFFISSAYQYVCHEEEQSLQLRCAVLFFPGLEWLLLVYSGGLPVHLCPMELNCFRIHTFC